VTEIRTSDGKPCEAVLGPQGNSMSFKAEGIG
jgi:hypothetical protein